jgi:hypothetical protein
MKQLEQDKMKFISVFLFFIGASIATAANDYNEWVKHFYQTQDVAQFDGYWQMVQKDHMLSARNQVNPVIGFSSQVFHSHPSLIKGRIDDLASFPEAERESVLKLLWLSDNREAQEILSKAGSEYIHKALPPIGAWKIDTGQDLDFCWGWFFATGEVTALDPIVSTLDFGKYAGALNKYKASRQTDEDRLAAFKDAMFGAALWSLRANAKEDPRISKHLEELLLNPKTPESRKPWLSLIFAKTPPSVSTR